MKIINEFDLSILPVQGKYFFYVCMCQFQAYNKYCFFFAVRSYSSKIDLIKECLDCDENAYKFVDKILQLAKLLAISDDDRKR